MTSRRQFLESLAAGAAGAVGVDQLIAAQSAFADHLAQDPAPIASLRGEYTVAPDVTYFNHASIGTVPRAVQEARGKYLATCESNPWLYMWGGAWEGARERTRTLAADVMGCRAAEVAITHNTTEGFNLLASGLPLGKGDEVLFSNLNHPGASACWRHWGERKGYSVRTFDIPLGRIDQLTKEALVAAHVQQISGRTKVLVLPHIDNMVGVRHPIRLIASAARRTGVKFVAVDGAQAVGMVPVSVPALGADAYATSPHKWLQAPKGLGLLYLREELQKVLAPMWVTWGQERWRGSVRIFEDYGTRNLPELLALGDAIEFQQALGAGRIQSQLKSLRARMMTGVDGITGIRWQSPRTWALGGSLYALGIDGADSRTVADRLWKKHKTVVRAFHAPGFDAIRVSPNAFNTEAEIDGFLATLKAEFLG